MVGFCHLTDSHHYHHGQKPTMVGICHGGNMPLGHHHNRDQISSSAICNSFPRHAVQSQVVAGSSQHWNDHRAHCEHLLDNSHNGLSLHRLLPLQETVSFLSSLELPTPSKWKINLRWTLKDQWLAMLLHRTKHYHNVVHWYESSLNRGKSSRPKHKPQMMVSYEINSLATDKIIASDLHYILPSLKRSPP